MIEIPRRKFLVGFASLIAAPAIVRPSSLMPVRVVPPYLLTKRDYFDDLYGEQIEKIVRPPMGVEPALKNEPFLIVEGHITYFSIGAGKKGFFPVILRPASELSVA
jgi:hypothetical protein